MPNPVLMFCTGYFHVNVCRLTRLQHSVVITNSKGFQFIKESEWLCLLAVYLQYTNFGFKLQTPNS